MVIEVRKTNWKKGLAFIMTAALIVTAAIPGGVSAKGKIKLNKKKVTVRVGQKVKLKLKNAKKKVQWKSSRKKVASVTAKGVVTAKKKGTAKITAKCGGRKYTCKVTVKAKNESIVESGAPDASAAPGASAGPSAKPTAKPSSKPGEGGKTSTTTAQPVKPSTAAQDTLAVGKLNVTLGMSKAQVEAMAGGKPDQDGKSPGGLDTYIYNPSGDYTNYIEMRFQNDKVVEMSTISPYFCYAGIVSSRDSVDTIKSNGFVKMTEFSVYEAAYKYVQSNAFVTVFADHQGDGGIYGIQIFDKTLNSNLKKLLMPTEYTYDDKVAALMQTEMRDYANAFRVYKGKTLMADSVVGAAQIHAVDMSSTGNTVTGDWQSRFEQNYGDWYAGYEFVCDACADAFSTIVYMIDVKGNKQSASEAYTYLTGAVLDQDGEPIGDSGYNIECGFAYNTGKKQVTYGVVDLYVLQ